jgi:transcriptional regulator with XRE-family HTH domain
MTTMLKSLRKERKMTQESLARVFHISQTSVSKYETGEAVPDLETAVKMADFFGVSLDEFVGREGDYQK